MINVDKSRPLNGNPQNYGFLNPKIHETCLNVFRLLDKAQLGGISMSEVNFDANVDTATDIKQHALWIDPSNLDKTLFRLNFLFTVQR